LCSTADSTAQNNKKENKGGCKGGLKQLHPQGLTVCSIELFKSIFSTSGTGGLKKYSESGRDRGCQIVKEAQEKSEKGTCGDIPIKSEVELVNEHCNTIKCV
jgi:hypothetical protein